MSNLHGYKLVIIMIVCAVVVDILLARLVIRFVVMRIANAQQTAVERGEHPARTARRALVTASPRRRRVKFAVHRKPVAVVHQQPTAALPPRAQKKDICNVPKLIHHP